MSLVTACYHGLRMRLCGLFVRVLGPASSATEPQPWKRTPLDLRGRSHISSQGVACRMGCHSLAPRIDLPHFSSPERLSDRDQQSPGRRGQFAFSVSRKSGHWSADQTIHFRLLPLDAGAQFPQRNFSQRSKLHASYASFKQIHEKFRRRLRLHPVICSLGN